MRNRDGTINYCGLKIRQNEGPLDRVIRTVLGLILIPTGLFVVGGIWKATLIIVGSIALVSGILGFCPMYIPLGISTREENL